MLNTGPYNYEADDWEDPQKTPRLPLPRDRVKTTIFQFVPKAAFTDHQQHIFRQADNITTITYAHVTGLETDENAKTVTRMQVLARDGNSFWVKAQKVVLAAGAIEIPRLLLNANQRRSCGLGNENDLVGRFFMEHPHLWSGRFIPSSDDLAGRTGLFRLHWVNQALVLGKLAIGDRVQRSDKILNYCVSIHPEVYKPRNHVAPDWPVISWPLLDPSNSQKNVRANGSGSFRREIKQMVKRAYQRVKQPPIVFKLNQMSEQAPNPDSRVTLSAEKDAFGINRVELNWQITPLDVRTIRRAQQVIDEELRKAGLGRLEMVPDDESLSSGMHGGWHHMGTTRMHEDPRRGVVDRNCRVHGMSNLYIAGPSVFPTGGYANPILTIVALSIRLADHIKDML
jgi:choline dehydrogenase-like flavoprotein